MERVAVVGAGGGGKTTFARELGEATGLPVVHLDEHFWSPGWVEMPRDRWQEVQRGLFSGDRWIADGNHEGTLDVRLSRADTVIIIARSRWACVAGAVRRRIVNRREPVQAEGCPEHFELSFLRWIWNFDRDSRPQLDAAIARQPHLTVVELTTRAQMQGFLEAIA